MVQSPYVQRGGADVDLMTFSGPSEESVTGHRCAWHPVPCLFMYKNSLQPNMFLLHNKWTGRLCSASSPEHKMLQQSKIWLCTTNSNSNKSACAVAYILLVIRAERVPLASQGSERRTFCPESLLSSIMSFPHKQH